MTAAPRIVSGGQTGVGRGALDAALDRQSPVGGWCPGNRKAEDGRIPDRYPLQELPSSGYIERTRRNIVDSDGTVIVYFEFPTGGTEQTLRFCLEEQQAYMLIDAGEVTVSRAIARVSQFVGLNGIAVLNVAGPRASGDRRGYGYTKRVIGGFLDLVAGQR